MEFTRQRSRMRMLPNLPKPWRNHDETMTKPWRNHDETTRILTPTRRNHCSTEIKDIGSLYYYFIISTGFVDCAVKLEWFRRGFVVVSSWFRRGLDNCAGNWHRPRAIGTVQVNWRMKHQASYECMVKRLLGMSNDVREACQKLALFALRIWAKDM